jgi:ketose-bisphosphate aldolase
VALMSAAPLVRDAARGGRVIVGFNVFSLESMSAVIRAGKDAGVPVIVTFNEADLAHVGIAEAVAVTRLKADAAGADVVLHLDHGMSLELAGRCISAGFTSVMIDTARYPRERRVEVARRVVDTAHAAGVSVESMLGTLELATAGEGEGSSEEELTDPGEAGSYSGLTGIDMLAVSVGSKHGSALIGEKVVLDMERLSAISRNVDVPLVVHGGSAVEEAQLRQLRTLGVGKMNIGSALRIAYRKSLAAALAEPRLDVRDCHARAGEAIYEAALQKIRVLTL